MRDFAVRLASAADISAVDALLARAYPRLLKPDYRPSVLVTALPLISRAQPRLITCGSYFVAEAADGAILGAGGWTPRSRASDIGNVRHLVTDDRHLRRGIARAILEVSHEQAVAQGVKLMNCDATITAEPFYTAMGYERSGEIAIALRPGIVFPAVRMIRRMS
ncbi:MAG: GNAT family N-acetyltransferase [Pseudomonadota bacterium]